MKQLLAKVTTAATVLATPTLVFGQVGVINPNDVTIINRLLRPIPIQPGQTFSLTQVVVIALNYLIFIAAVIAIFYLIWAGIKYITASTENEDATKAARKSVFNAIIGIVIITLSFVIIQVVVGLSGDVVRQSGGIQSGGGLGGGFGTFFGN